MDTTEDFEIDEGVEFSETSAWVVLISTIVVIVIAWEAIKALIKYLFF